MKRQLFPANMNRFIIITTSALSNVMITESTSIKFDADRGGLLSSYSDIHYCTCFSLNHCIRENVCNDTVVFYIRSCKTVQLVVASSQTRESRT